jgi:hypothetical protein
MERLRQPTILAMVVNELMLAQEQFPPFHSTHEGYAVILEELDELWDEIKRCQPFNWNSRLHNKAVQIAAMAIRFILDGQRWTKPTGI